jgi:[acyl-carrier-protein] S-malonyltransferase
MTKKMAFLFPGQGAQYVGMMKDFYDVFSVARETFEEADDLLNQSLSKLIFEGPAPELTLTKNSQVAIYVSSMAIWRTLTKEAPHLKPAVTAGLSLGEYTALTAAGWISFAECLSLVQARALYMNEACERTKGVMSVVLGLEEAQVEAVVSPLTATHQVWVANLNCPGQVVIAGTPEGVQFASEKLKEAGAKRVLPLDVSGAFHSGLMHYAQEKLQQPIQKAVFTQSLIPVVMNVPGEFVSDIQQIRKYLFDQVASPVRWEKGIRAMDQQGVTYYVEMGPGKTLAGMNKRIGITHPTLSIEKVADLEVTIESLTKVEHASIIR